MSLLLYFSTFTLKCKLNEDFQALVLWQDGTMSDERTVSVDPYDNIDEYEVWPGDRVSYLPSEDHVVCEGKPLVRLGKVGIVQSVHPSKRTANVRWFLPCQLVMNEDTEASYNGGASGIMNAVSVYCPAACFMVFSSGSSHTRVVER